MVFFVKERKTMYDFIIEQGVLRQYSGNETEVVIPDCVTAIGDRAFFQCTSLTSVIIPDSVTSIGQGAFLECSNLTSIIIPKSGIHR